MHYDLHIHSAEYSPCSSLPAEDACRLATALGIRGIAFTEHDLWWPATEMIDLQARHQDLIILNGMECTCREGHFLVFLPSEHNDFSQPPDTINALTQWTHARSGIVIWAHPFRYEPLSVPAWLQTAALDGIEVASSNMPIATRELAVKVAEDFGLTPFSNSDAHREEDLGFYLNMFNAELDRVEALIRFLNR